MPFYSFEYFCGANVLVRVAGMPLLECSGISYQTQESKMPLYGYSSRHFDGVARGQVLIRGTLLVNYVHQDYLYHAMRLGKEKLFSPTPNTTSEVTAPRGDVSESLKQQGLEAIANDLPEAIGFVQHMKDTHWVAENFSDLPNPLHETWNPHDLGDAVDVKIIFGDQNSGHRIHGMTGTLLRGVHFTGRGRVITIDEQVIGEAYDFFARNELSLAPVYNRNVLDSPQAERENETTDPDNLPIQSESF